MNTLRKWFLGVWAQFIAGLALLGTRDGKQKFLTLLWSNVVTQVFVFFDLLLLPILVVLWFDFNADNTSQWYFLGICVVWVALYCTILSIFDIPNFASEKRHLDEHVRVLNPLHVFILAPIRWARSALTKRRAS